MFTKSALWESPFEESQIFQLEGQHPDTPLYNRLSLIMPIYTKKYHAIKLPRK